MNFHWFRLSVGTWASTTCACEMSWLKNSYCSSAIAHLCSCFTICQIPDISAVSSGNAKGYVNAMTYKRKKAREDTCIDRPLGTLGWSIVGEMVQFQPRFQLWRGVRYLRTCQGCRNSQSYIFRYWALWHSTIWSQWSVVHILWDCLQIPWCCGNPRLPSRAIPRCHLVQWQD